MIRKIIKFISQVIVGMLLLLLFDAFLGACVWAWSFLPGTIQGLLFINVMLAVAIALAVGKSDD